VVGKAEWIIFSVAESERTTKPRCKKSKKSIMAGDLDLATLEGRAKPRFIRHLAAGLPAPSRRALREVLLRPQRDGKPH
jgi:hypothetical protein